MMRTGEVAGFCSRGINFEKARRMFESAYERLKKEHEHLDEFEISIDVSVYAIAGEEEPDDGTEVQKDEEEESDK